MRAPLQPCYLPGGAVLTRWTCVGINRKVQLKPLAWAPRDRQRKQRHSGLLDAFIRHSVVAGDEISDDAAEGATDAASAPATAAAAAAAAAAAFNLHGGEGERLGEAMAGVDASAWAEEELPDEIVTEALLVLKWGGVLTNAGVLQAEDLGWRFRNSLYPGEQPAARRCHASRERADPPAVRRRQHGLSAAAQHVPPRSQDLRIGRGTRAGCERRARAVGAAAGDAPHAPCAVTASAFVRKFLDLEGPLTPILVSLVGSGPTATKARAIGRPACLRLRCRIARPLALPAADLRGSCIAHAERVADAG